MTSVLLAALLLFLFFVSAPLFPECWLWKFEESQAVSLRKALQCVWLKKRHEIAGTLDRRDMGLRLFLQTNEFVVFADSIPAAAPLFAYTRLLELRFRSRALKAADRKQSFLTHRLLLLRSSTRCFPE